MKEKSSKYFLPYKSRVGRQKIFSIQAVKAIKKFMFQKLISVVNNFIVLVLMSIHGTVFIYFGRGRCFFRRFLLATASVNDV